MAYAPVKHLHCTDDIHARTCIYDKMWTGHVWWEIQVSPLKPTHNNCLLGYTLSMYHTGKAPLGCHSRAHHTVRLCDSDSAVQGSVGLCHGCVMAMFAVLQAMLCQCIAVLLCFLCCCAFLCRYSHTHVYKHTYSLPNP